MVPNSSGVISVTRPFGQNLGSMFEFSVSWLISPEMIRNGFLRLFLHGAKYFPPSNSQVGPSGNSAMSPGERVVLSIFAAKASIFCDRTSSASCFLKSIRFPHAMAPNSSAVVLGYPVIRPKFGLLF